MATSVHGVHYVCQRGPDHDGPCYKWLEPTVNLTSLSSDKFIVILGVSWGSPGTRTANSQPFSLTIADGKGLTVDGMSVNADSYVASPASGGTIYVLTLPRRMLIPPGGSILWGGASGNVSMLECATLEDAVAAL